MTYTAAPGLIARLSTATDQLPALPDFDAPAELCDWVKSRWADEDFAAAVTFASPHLADATTAVLAGDATDRDARRVAVALARYTLRHHSRATPFGTWAASLPATIGPAAMLDLPARPTLVHYIAPNSQAAEAVSRAHPGARGFGEMSLCRNPLAYERPTCIVLPWAPTATVDSEPRTVTVQRTKPLSTLWDAAREPITVTELTKAVIAAHPKLNVEACHRVIARLIEHRLLLADAFPSTTTPPTRARTPNASTFTNATYPAAVAVPEPVARIAARAADLLLKLSPHPSGDPAWHDYHRRWLDRYHLGEAVPLTRLLDPASGLGPPAGYRGSAYPAPAPAFGERDRRLLALAEQTLLANEPTLHLTDALIADLQQGEVVPPPCAEVTLTAAAETPEAVADGEFTVHSASPSLFHTAGRHLTYLDPAATTAARAAMDDLQAAHPGWRWAQTSAVPLAEELRDLASHPQLLDTIVPIGEHPDATALRLERIGITGDARRLWAVDLDTGAPLRVLTCNAIEPVKYQHPATRMLSELTFAFTTALGPWSWGAASALPVLPRVQYGPLILAPARWRLDATRLDPNQPFTDWDQDLSALDDRLPRFVAVGDNDMRHTLDLDQPGHRQLLHIEERRTGKALLRETPSPGSADWIASRAHELNIPLIAGDQPAPPARLQPSDAPALQPPGTGRWWSLHLFTDPAEAERLITRHLPDLASKLAGRPAWFVHYPEPAPHLRIRLPRNGPGDLDAIAEWTAERVEAGQISDSHLATYRPETSRYGTGPLLAAIEDFFVADSACAAAILEATEPASVGRDAATAASLVHLAEALADTPGDAWAWLLDHVDQRAPEAMTATRDARERNRDVVALARRLHVAPVAIGTPWPDRRTAAATYRSLHRAAETPPDLGAVTAAALHLHCNRVYGPDPEAEHRLLHYARSLALAAHRQQGAHR